MIDFINNLLLLNVFAQGSEESSNIGTEGYEGTDITLPTAILEIKTIGQVVAFVLNVITGIGWSIAFVYFALGFIKYITSKGETKATEEAQKMITYAVVGGIGLLLLGAVRTIIENIVGGSLPPDYVPGTNTEPSGPGTPA